MGASLSRSSTESDTLAWAAPYGSSSSGWIPAISATSAIGSGATAWLMSMSEGTGRAYTTRAAAAATRGWKATDADAPAVSDAAEAAAIASDRAWWTPRLVVEAVV